MERDKRLVNFFFYGFLFFGILFLIGKKSWFPDFYYTSFMAGTAFLSAFIIILPRLIFKTTDSQKKSVLAKIQLRLSYCLILNGLGGMGLFKLYKIGFQYDKLIHFLVPFILCLTIVDFLNNWFGVEPEKIIYLTALLIIVLGVTWEFFEYATDAVFGSKTFGLYGLDITTDTLWDNIFNFLGIITAVLFKKFSLRNK